MWAADGEGWLWGANSGCHLTPGRKTRTSVLRRQGNKFHPQPEWGWKRPLTPAENYSFGGHIDFSFVVPCPKNTPTPGPFWPSELWANKWVLFSAPGVCCFIMWQQKASLPSQKWLSSLLADLTSLPPYLLVFILKSSPVIHVSHTWWYGLSKMPTCPHHTTSLEPFHSPHFKVNFNRLLTWFQCL